MPSGAQEVEAQTVPGTQQEHGPWNTGHRLLYWEVQQVCSLGKIIRLHPMFTFDLTYF